MKIILKKIKVLIKPLIFYSLLGISYLIPRNKKIWLFGGVSGTFNDNVKHLYIYITENCPEIRAIWISTDKNINKYIKSKGLEAYYNYSLKGIYFALIGKFYFFFTYPSNINLWASGGAIKINLWHGVPIKKIEFDIKNNFACNFSFKNLFSYPERCMKYHHVLSTSKKVSKLFSSAFRVDRKNCLELGYPRNQILSYSEDKIVNFIEKYEPSETKKLIFSLKKYDKIFIYMPTWRDNGRDFIKDANINFELLNCVMQKKNHFLILKLHHMTKLTINLKKYKNIFLLDNNLDVYPILPFTDCLITDYSSIFFDYKLMKKEVILFPFDKEEYIAKDREMYYSYDFVTENQSVANNFEELIELIQSDKISINDNNLLKEMIFETRGIDSSEEIVKSTKKLYNIKL